MAVLAALVGGSKLAPHDANACAVLGFAGGALNPAFDQRDATRPFGYPAQGSPQQAGGYQGRVTFQSLGMVWVIAL